MKRWMDDRIKGIYDTNKERREDRQKTEDLKKRLIGKIYVL